MGKKKKSYKDEILQAALGKGEFHPLAMADEDFEKQKLLGQQYDYFLSNFNTPDDITQYKNYLLSTQFVKYGVESPYKVVGDMRAVFDPNYDIANTLPKPTDTPEQEVYKKMAYSLALNKGKAQQMDFFEDAIANHSMSGAFYKMLDSTFSRDFGIPNLYFSDEGIFYKGKRLNIDNEDLQSLIEFQTASTTSPSDTFTDKVGKIFLGITFDLPLLMLTGGLSNGILGASQIYRAAAQSTQFLPRLLARATQQAVNFNILGVPQLVQTFKHDDIGGTLNVVWHNTLIGTLAGTFSGIGATVGQKTGKLFLKQSPAFREELAALASTGMFGYTLGKIGGESDEDALATGLAFMATHFTSPHAYKRVLREIKNKNVYIYIDKSDPDIPPNYFVRKDNQMYAIDSNAFKNRGEILPIKTEEGKDITPIEFKEEEFTPINTVQDFYITKYADALKEIRIQNKGKQIYKRLIEGLDPEYVEKHSETLRALGELIAANIFHNKLSKTFTRLRLPEDSALNKAMVVFRKLQMPYGMIKSYVVKNIEKFISDPEKFIQQVRDRVPPNLAKAFEDAMLAAIEAKMKRAEEERKKAEAEVLNQMKGEIPEKGVIVPPTQEEIAKYGKTETQITKDGKIIIAGEEYEPATVNGKQVLVKRLPNGLYAIKGTSIEVELSPTTEKGLKLENKTEVPEKPAETKPKVNKSKKGKKGKKTEGKEKETKLISENQFISRAMSGEVYASVEEKKARVDQLRQEYRKIKQAFEEQKKAIEEQEALKEQEQQKEGEKNDKENIEGIPSGIKEGETSIETKPVEEGSRKKTKAGRILQTQEKVTPSEPSKAKAQETPKEVKAKEEKPPVASIEATQEQNKGQANINIDQAKEAPPSSNINEFSKKLETVDEIVNKISKDINVINKEKESIKADLSSVQQFLEDYAKEQGLKGKAVARNLLTTLLSNRGLKEREVAALLRLLGYKDANEVTVKNAKRSVNKYINRIPDLSDKLAKREKEVVGEEQPETIVTPAEVAEAALRPVEKPQNIEQRAEVVGKAEQKVLDYLEKAKLDITKDSDYLKAYKRFTNDEDALIALNILKLGKRVQDYKTDETVHDLIMYQMVEQSKPASLVETEKRVKEMNRRFKKYGVTWEIGYIEQDESGNFRAGLTAISPEGVRVVIDPRYARTDTIPHEQGHVLLYLAENKKAVDSLLKKFGWNGDGINNTYIEAHEKLLDALSNYEFSGNPIIRRIREVLERFSNLLKGHGFYSESQFIRKFLENKVKLQEHKMAYYHYAEPLISAAYSSLPVIEHYIPNSRIDYKVKSYDVLKDDEIIHINDLENVLKARGIKEKEAKYVTDSIKVMSDLSAVAEKGLKKFTGTELKTLIKVLFEPLYVEPHYDFGAFDAGQNYKVANFLATSFNRYGYNHPLTKALIKIKEALKNPIIDFDTGHNGYVMIYEDEFIPLSDYEKINRYITETVPESIGERFLITPEEGKVLKEAAENVTPETSLLGYPVLERVTNIAADANFVAYPEKIHLDRRNILFRYGNQKFYIAHDYFNDTEHFGWVRVSTSPPQERSYLDAPNALIVHEIQNQFQYNRLPEIEKLRPDAFIKIEGRKVIVIDPNYQIDNDKGIIIKAIGYVPPKFTMVATELDDFHPAYEKYYKEYGEGKYYYISHKKYNDFRREVIGKLSDDIYTLLKDNAYFIQLKSLIQYAARRNYDRIAIVRGERLKEAENWTEHEEFLNLEKINYRKVKESEKDITSIINEMINTKDISDTKAKDLFIKLYEKLYNTYAEVKEDEEARLPSFTTIRDIYHDLEIISAGLHLSKDIVVDFIGGDRLGVLINKVWEVKEFEPLKSKLDRISNLKYFVRDILESTRIYDIEHPPEMIKDDKGLAVRYYVGDYQVRLAEMFRALKQDYEEYDRIRDEIKSKLEKQEEKLLLVNYEHIYDKYIKLLYDYYAKDFYDKFFDENGQIKDYVNFYLLENKYVRQDKVEVFKDLLAKSINERIDASKLKPYGLDVYSKTLGGSRTRIFMEYVYEAFHNPRTFGYVNPYLKNIAKDYRNAFIEDVMAVEDFYGNMMPSMLKKLKIDHFVTDEFTYIPIKPEHKGTFYLFQTIGQPYTKETGKIIDLTEFYAAYDDMKARKEGVSIYEKFAKHRLTNDFIKISNKAYEYAIQTNNLAYQRRTDGSLKYPNFNKLYNMVAEDVVFKVPYHINNILSNPDGWSKGKHFRSLDNYSQFDFTVRQDMMDKLKKYEEAIYEGRATEPEIRTDITGKPIETLDEAHTRIGKAIGWTQEQIQTDKYTQKTYQQALNFAYNGTIDFYANLKNQEGEYIAVNGLPQKTLRRIFGVDLKGKELYEHAKDVINKDEEKRWEVAVELANRIYPDYINPTNPFYHNAVRPAKLNNWIIRGYKPRHYTTEELKLMSRKELLSFAKEYAIAIKDRGVYEKLEEYSDEELLDYVDSLFRSGKYLKSKAWHLYTYAESSKEADKIAAEWADKGFIIEEKFHIKEAIEKGDYRKLTAKELINLANSGDVPMNNEVFKALLEATKSGTFEAHKLQKSYVYGLHRTPKEYEMLTENFVREAIYSSYRRYGLDKARDYINRHRVEISDYLKKYTVPDKVKRYAYRELELMNKFYNQVAYSDASFIDGTRQLATTYYIGIKPSFWFQQLTQVLQTILPESLAESLNGFKHWVNGFSDALKLAYEIIARSKGETTKAVPEDLYSLYETFDKANKMGATGIRELTGEINQVQLHYDKNVNNLFKQFAKVANMGGAIVEKFTRLHSLAVWYRIAKEKGLSGNELIEYIRTKHDEVMSLWGASGRPLVLSPTELGRKQQTVVKALMKSFYTFRTFTLANLGQYDRLMRGRNWGALGIKFAVGVGLHGIRNFPLYATIMALANLLAEDDMDYEALKAFDEANLSVLGRGVSSAVGLELGNLFDERSVYVTDIVSYMRGYSVEDRLASAMLGAPYGVSKDIYTGAVELYETIKQEIENTPVTEEKKQKALKNLGRLTPLFVRNVLTAMSLKEDGLTYQNKQLIKKEDLDGIDILYKILGFQPTKIQQAYELQFSGLPAKWTRIKGKMKELKQIMREISESKEYTKEEKQKQLKRARELYKEALQEKKELIKQKEFKVLLKQGLIKM